MSIFRKIEKAISKVIPHQHSADLREKVSQMKEQKAAYQQQTAQLQEEKSVVDYDKKKEAQRATSAFKRLRSGGSGLSQSEMSISSKLG